MKTIISFAQQNIYAALLPSIDSVATIGGLALVDDCGMRIEICVKVCEKLRANGEI